MHINLIQNKKFLKLDKNIKKVLTSNKTYVINDLEQEKGESIWN